MIVPFPRLSNEASVGERDDPPAGPAGRPHPRRM